MIFISKSLLSQVSIKEKGCIIPINGNFIDACLWLLFTGEWTSEWEFKGGTKKDYQRFAKAELKVYKRATFGWAYWTLKNVNNHWNLEWMIKNDYIKI